MDQGTSELFQQFNRQFPKITEPVLQNEKLAEKEQVTPPHTQDTKNTEGETMTPVMAHTVATSLPRKVGKVVKEVFGQFFTSLFWKDFFKTLVQESLSAFLISAGQTMIFIGKSNKSTQVANAVVNMPMNNAPATIASRAFGPGGVSPVSTTPNSQTLKNFGFNT